MNKEAIISFSHTNYCLQSAGTEKFIRGLSENIQSAGYSHLNIFSFYDDKNLMKTKLFGVNYNDQFVGIYKYNDMMTAVDNLLCQYELKIRCIHLEHLLHHDTEMIKKIIFQMRVPVYVMVHDYFLVCPELKLISTNHGFCGLTPPSQEKCNGCAYGNKAKKHFDTIKHFLNEISPWLQCIITPSEFVAKSMKLVFPEYKEIIAIRQHLEYDCAEVPDRKIQGKIRIAFAGAQMTTKGYEQWKALVSCIPDGIYEFYYLGLGKERIRGVKNIYVSSAEQGDNAMSKALEMNKIHVAFLWPNWAETYSYVLYELAENGVYILTNNISGNICDVVDKEKNGQIFETLQDCIEFLLEEKKAKTIINDFRVHGKFHIKNVRTNIKLEGIIPETQVLYAPKKNNKKVSQKRLETLLYRIKYIKRI